MSEINPPVWLQKGSHAAQGMRRLLATLTEGREGYYATGDFLVAERAAGVNMSVDVAEGRAYILATETTYGGTYFVESQGVTNVVVSASDPALARIDIIVAQVEDSDEGAGATDAWGLNILTGTPDAVPVAPTLPDNALLLATIAVGAAVTTIVDANITDNRTQYNPGYAQEIFTSGGTWTKADYPWAKWVRVRVVAGGGGGGGCPTTGSGAMGVSGGGGGGGYGESTLSVDDLGTTETVTVGTGGAGGAAGANGSTGNASSFGSHVVTAGGGGGGYSNASAAPTGALGGDAGTASAGQIQLNGSGGSTGKGFGYLVSNQGFGGAGGAGGGSVGGGGTDDRRVGEGAKAGSSYGGGGSGTAVLQSTTGVTGGAGATGVVIAEMFG